MDWKLKLPQAGNAVYSISHTTARLALCDSDLLREFSVCKIRRHSSNWRFQWPHVDCFNVILGHNAKSKFSDYASWAASQEIPRGSNSSSGLSRAVSESLHNRDQRRHRFDICAWARKPKYPQREWVQQEFLHKKEEVYLKKRKLEEAMMSVKYHECLFKGMRLNFSASTYLK